VILLIDYGYTRKEYYLPERTMGTLICHYQHRTHNNPLIYPSLQDITANVDFTAVAESASNAGLDVLGFSNQATFLAASGLEQCFLATLQQQPEQQYQLAQQIRTLSLPAEMGERFKVIALGKAIKQPLSGFSMGDQLHRL
jgi:SAM-dependent MidA family methyltransferase